MKISIDYGRLLIEPETEFEDRWMSRYMPPGTTAKAWLKNGLTAKDIIGIVVEPSGRKEADND